MKLKMAYDNFMAASDESGLECKDRSLTVQSSVEETDINTIVRRFGLTGQLPVDLAMPQFVDFDAVWDFHSAMNLVAEAKEAFMKMPGDVRERFRNDPQELMAFVENPANLEEARKLGLAVPAPKADEPIRVDVVPRPPVVPPGGTVVP